jgi:hypothetical protein
MCSPLWPVVSVGWGQVGDFSVIATKFREIPLGNCAGGMGGDLHLPALGLYWNHCHGD